MGSGEASLVLNEEEVSIGKEEQTGAVHARKVVETRRYKEVIPRQFDSVDMDRVPVEGEDSGEVQTLPDGSISIPIFEEEVVVTKRLVLRERVIIRKRTEIEQYTVETERRRERVEIKADPNVKVEHRAMTDAATGDDSSQG